MTLGTQALQEHECVLQHIVIKADLPSGAESLYVRHSRLSLHGLRHTTDTYINLFHKKRWQDLTGISSYSMQISCRGKGRLELHGAFAPSSEGGPVTAAPSVLLDACTVNSPEASFYWSPRLNGAYDFFFLAWEEESEGTLRIDYAQYAGTPADKPRSVRIAIVTTTYQRREDLGRLVTMYRRACESTPEISLSTHLFIINNERKDEEFLQQYAHQQISIITNTANLGGSGGFAQGARLAVEDGSFSHVLFMDDDALATEESWFRTLQLSACLRKELYSHPLSGAMFTREQPAYCHAILPFTTRPFPYYGKGLLFPCILLSPNHALFLCPRQSILPPQNMNSITFSNTLPLAVIAGPCAMESRSQTLEAAAALKEIFTAARIPLIFKSSFDKANRSSGTSFRGVGMSDGLAILADVREQYALPVITDIHLPEQATPVAEVADILQIPAFLCRQTDLLLAAAATGKPVNIKKGQFLSPWEMRHVLAKARSTGNDGICLCERGTSFGYNNLVVDMRGLEIMKATGYPVIFDATHSVQLPGAGDGRSGGQREFVATLARAAVAVGIAGLFLETHPDPDRAPCDGPNMLPFSALPSLLDLLKELDSLVKATATNREKDIMVCVPWQ